MLTTRAVSPFRPPATRPSSDLLEDLGISVVPNAFWRSSDGATCPLETLTNTFSICTTSSKSFQTPVRHSRTFLVACDLESLASLAQTDDGYVCELIWFAGWNNRIFVVVEAEAWSMMVRRSGVKTNAQLGHSCSGSNGSASEICRGVEVDMRMLSQHPSWCLRASSWVFGSKVDPCCMVNQPAHANSCTINAASRSAWELHRKAPAQGPRVRGEAPSRAPIFCLPPFTLLRRKKFLVLILLVPTIYFMLSYNGSAPSPLDPAVSDADARLSASSSTCYQRAGW